MGPITTALIVDCGCMESVGEGHAGFAINDDALARGRSWGWRSHGAFQRSKEDWASSVGVQIWLYGLTLMKFEQVRWLMNQLELRPAI